MPDWGSAWGGAVPAALRLCLAAATVNALVRFWRLAWRVPIFERLLTEVEEADRRASLEWRFEQFPLIEERRRQIEAIRSTTQQWLLLHATTVFLGTLALLVSLQVFR